MGRSIWNRVVRIFLIHGPSPASFWFLIGLFNKNTSPQEKLWKSNWWCTFSFSWNMQNQEYLSVVLFYYRKTEQKNVLLIFEIFVLYILLIVLLINEHFLLHCKLFCANLWTFRSALLIFFANLLIFRTELFKSFCKFLNVSSYTVKKVHLCTCNGE